MADINSIKDACGVVLDPKECTVDAVVDLPDAAAKWIQTKHKDLIEQVKVKGVAKEPAIGPAK